MTTPASGLDSLFLSFQLALAGRYSIDRELGRGGMGVVYLAREVHLDRLIAIKLLPPDKAGDPLLRQHFLREARLAAKLSHPNIIPIHTVDETHGFVFYVMSFIDGETLEQRVRTRGPLSSGEAARVLREVAWALSHAHSHGLVHRDVKPDNILIENGTGRVLVADFGIAFAVQDAGSAVRTGFGGTPEFMSPEQALGQDVDARSDLYALGITGFYALTGRLPFEGENATELLAKQVTVRAPALASMGVPVARNIAVLIERCLAKDPAERPQSADALAEQLGMALEQRREPPAALRFFVKRASRLNRGGLIPLFTLFGFQTFVAANLGLRAAAGVFVFGTAAVTFGYMSNAARRLMKLGFVHADVGPAFTSEIERAREEAAIEHGRGASLIERVLLLTAKVTGGASATAVLTGLVSGFTPTMVTIAALGAAVAFPAMAGALGLMERRRDVDTEFWAKVWASRVGRAAFWLGRKLGGSRTHETAVTHRATELALGMAAESLFEKLPQTTQRALGDVPALVRRLEEDAKRLRKLYSELNEALSGSAQAAFSDAHTGLRADRDRIHAKLADTVRALETIRLHLLKLHAGAGTVESLTTDIDLATQVSAEVERLLEARKEVERSLLFPRTTAPTPA